MNARVLVAFAALLCLTHSVAAQYPGAKPPPERWEVGFDSIDHLKMREHLTFLASENLEGRGTGQPGYHKAARFVSDRFKEFMLKPMGHNKTFFQNVRFTRSRVNPKKSYLLAETAGVKISPGADLLFRSPADQPIKTMDVVFVQTNDLSNLAKKAELDQKLVILISNDRSGVATLLQNASPQAVFTVRNRVDTDYWYTSKIARSSSNRCLGELSLDAARRLVKALGVDEKVLKVPTDLKEARLTTAKSPLTVVTETEAQDVLVPNVIGLLPGSDPALKDETVVIGAHLDHLGVSPTGAIYPGADDNASGVTAMLAVAEAIHINKVKPRRSVLFIAFCGEEIGLVGSQYYVRHPVVPIDKTVCMINLDMVGRQHMAGNKMLESDDTLFVIGTDMVPSNMKELVDQANAYLSFKTSNLDLGLFNRSDHYNFAQKGVPTAFFFSGFHADYHQPSDKADKIDYHKLASIARLVYVTTQITAAQERKPTDCQGKPN